MSKKIRIHNDILVNWTITRNGEPEDFGTLTNYSVKLVDDRNIPQEISYSAAANVLSINFRGKNQLVTGKYRLILYENEGIDGMISIDHVDVFEIVPHSFQTGGTDEDDVETISVNLEDNIEIGQQLEQVQADWDVTDTQSKAYIKHKPTIPSQVTEQTVSEWGFTKNTGTYSKPASGIPSTDLETSVKTSLGKADTAVQPSALYDYSTTAQMNSAIAAHHDSTKQDVISDLSTIRSGAALGATALQSVPNTYRTSAAQDIIDSGKVDKETGKGLSTNDYTTAEKAKLAGVEEGAEENVQPDWNQSDTTADDYIKHKPTIPSQVTEQTVSGWGFTKNTGTYSKPASGIPSTDLETSVQTSLGKADTAVQPSALYDYSTTAQMNSAIAAHHDSAKHDKIDSSHKLDYSLVSNTPSIPTATSQLTNDSGFLTQHQDISGKLDKNYTAQDAGKIAKVDSDGVLKILPASTASVGFADITGSPSENTALSNALAEKGTYSKPASGIPSTDLETSVQTSLVKADTAVQPSALNDYSTTAQMNSAIAAHHDSTKQDKIDSSHKLDYSLVDNTPSIPTATSQLTNDSGFITQHQDISGKENASNKVTSFQQNPDNSHYPSEKLVNDNLDSLCSWEYPTTSLVIEDSDGKIHIEENKSISSGYIIDSYPNRKKVIMSGILPTGAGSILGNDDEADRQVIYYRGVIKTNTTSLTDFLNNAAAMIECDLSGSDTTNVTSFRKAFMSCSSLTNIDVSSFNTENAISMYGMFNGCSSLTNLNLSHFITSNVTSMVGMFSNCSSLVTLDISGFDTIGLSSYNSMFSTCSSLTNLSAPQNGTCKLSISFSQSPLSYESVVSVFGWLSDSPTGNPTCSFKSGLYNEFTEEQKSVIDALKTAKVSNGWTITNMG